MRFKVKIIPGFGLRYYAGSDGCIYSFFTNRGPRPKPLRLSPSPNKDGYPMLTLVDAGKKRSVPVHVLVARAFLGSKPPGKEIRHKDGSRTNSRPTNLCYGTRKDNADDRQQHGRTARGEKSGTAIFTNAQVRTIKRRLGNGELQKQIATEFGVHKTTIQAIASGRNWKWLQAHQ